MDSFLLRRLKFGEIDSFNMDPAWEEIFRQILLYKDQQEEGSSSDTKGGSRLTLKQIRVLSTRMMDLRRSQRPPELMDWLIENTMFYKVKELIVFKAKEFPLQFLFSFFF